MADFATTRDTLLLNLRARIPFIGVRTDERTRALELFHVVSRSLDTPIYYQPNETHATVAHVLEQTAARLHQRQNLTVVLTELQHLDRDGSLTRGLQALVLSSIDQGGVICAISADRVWTGLRRLGIALTLDPPTQDEMAALLGEFLDQYRGEVAIEWEPADIRRVGSIMAGVTRLEAQNQLLPLIAKGSVLKSDIAALARARDVLVADSTGLERVQVGPADLCIAGLGGLRLWLRKRQPLFRMDLRDRGGLRQPRGVLVFGVPGCGKSLSAHLLAREWSLALYRLDVASLRGQHGNQLHKALEHTLASLERLAPCVIWMDEIERILSDADVAASRRLVATFLAWLSDGTRGVFVVCTANVVGKVPAQLIQRGHFDELFFVDLPNDPERREIICAYAQRYLGVQPAEPLLEALVLTSHGFACSDLEAACAEVAQLALLDATEPAQAQRWLAVFANVTPLVRTNPEHVERLRAWARARAVPASGQPISQSGTSDLPGRVVIA